MTQSKIPKIDLFEYDNHVLREGSIEWNEKLFVRAYCISEGKFTAPFQRVCERIRIGFPVLAYVPGSCMEAAASYIIKSIPERAWSEYLQHPEKDQTLSDVWKTGTGIVSKLREWFEGNEEQQPGAIFHNLDFLTDGRGGIFPDSNAQTAVAGLVGGARKGVVLGLSDRNERVLPPPIARAFDEQIRLDAIPYENFHRIIPMELAEILPKHPDDSNYLAPGPISLLASRLRWTDPIRAYRIMQHAVANNHTFEDVEKYIRSATQTLDFVDPCDIDAKDEVLGYPNDTILLLQKNIVMPYQQLMQDNSENINQIADWRAIMEKLQPGLILYGPPGTGKTHLTRWIAKKIGLPIRIVSGGELRAASWGDAEKNVRDLFRVARQSAPCVLVLDDADDLLPDRSSASGSVASSERAVVNEFLQQLEGFHGRLEGVLVILTTNRFDALDNAAKQRLSMHFHIPYPLSEEQIQQIVCSVATKLDIDLTPDIKAQLVNRFFQSINPNAQNFPRNEEARRSAKPGELFAPRDIEQAMRMLIRSPRKGYCPTLEDVQEMNNYYAKVSLPNVE